MYQTFNMKLCAEPFKKVCTGEKTIEYRLHDEKRAQLRKGDRILFTELSKEEKTALVEVVDIFTAPSFTALKKDLVERGLIANEEFSPSVMRKYYSATDEKKYGVMGIEIKLINQMKEETLTLNEQIIDGAIADCVIESRIPVDKIQTINELIRISRQLLQGNGREPTPDEIAVEMGITAEKVREFLGTAQEEDRHIGDFTKEQLVEVLGTLTDREQEVIKLRFGLEDGRIRTPEEVEKKFDVTNERIRQIEAKAMRKLRYPTRSRKLKDYLE